MLKWHSSSTSGMFSIFRFQECSLDVSGDTRPRGEREREIEVEERTIEWGKVGVLGGTTRNLDGSYGTSDRRPERETSIRDGSRVNHRCKKGGGSYRRRGSLDGTGGINYGFERTTTGVWGLGSMGPDGKRNKVSCRRLYEDCMNCKRI